MEKVKKVKKVNNDLYKCEGHTFTIEKSPFNGKRFYAVHRCGAYDIESSGLSSTKTEARNALKYMVREFNEKMLREYNRQAR